MDTSNDNNKTENIKRDCINKPKTIIENKEVFDETIDYDSKLRNLLKERPGIHNFSFGKPLKVQTWEERQVASDIYVKRDQSNENTLYRSDYKWPKFEEDWMKPQVGYHKNRLRKIIKGIVPELQKIDIKEEVEDFGHPIFGFQCQS